MADVRWVGSAIAVAQVGTITVGGTWATSDTASLTIGGKVLTITLGATTTTAQVVNALVAAVNGTALADDETRNAVGTSFGEWAGITAVATSSTVLTLTGDTAGVPFTVTTDKAATSGTIGNYSATTAATGPNDWANAENWSTGSVPVNSDDVYIQAGSVDILYGLDQSSVTLTTLYIDASYSGNIGLPLRTSDAIPYEEYREDYLSISATTVIIGRGGTGGASRLKLDTGTNATNITVHNLGSTFRWKGSHATNVLTVEAGTVEVAPYAGETAQIDVLNASGGIVRCYDGTTLDEIEVDGGTVTVENNSTAITLTGGTVNVNGSATVTTLTNRNGTCNYGSSGTITNLHVYSTTSFEVNTNSRTVTNATIYPGGTLKDKNQTVTWTNKIALGGNYRQLRVS